MLYRDVDGNGGVNWGADFNTKTMTPDHLPGQRRFFESICDSNPASEAGIRGLHLVVECEELRRQVEFLRRGQPVVIRQFKGGPVENVMAHLEAADWNCTMAARQLGVSRANLYTLMTRYGLSRRDRVAAERKAA